MTLDHKNEKRTNKADALHRFSDLKWKYAQVLNTSRKGDSFHFGLALRLFVVAGVIMASSTLWTFSSSDIRSLGPVMVCLHTFM